MIYLLFRASFAFLSNLTMLATISTLVLLSMQTLGKDATKLGSQFAFKEGVEIGAKMVGEGLKISGRVIGAAVGAAASIGFGIWCQCH
jgi:hypothetical protein